MHKYDLYISCLLNNSITLIQCFYHFKKAFKDLREGYIQTKNRPRACFY